MSESELAERVADWEAKLTLVNRNFMDLTQSDATKRIEARLKDAAEPYRGLTAARARAAFDALDGKLAPDYLMLLHVVEQAAQLARKSSIFRNTEPEVLALLEGGSVAYPAVAVPLPARGLLSEAEQTNCARPAEVLEAMQHAFAEARDALVAIDAAETALAPRLVTLADQGDRLKRRAAALGLAAATQQALAPLAELAADPLQAAQLLDRAAAALASETARLDAIERERAAVTEALATARAGIAELRELPGQLAAAIEETRLKIADPPAPVPPLATTAVDELAAWLATLEATTAAGRWDAAAVGAKRLGAALAERLAQARDGLARNRAALDERADLRGRMSALGAKTDALLARGLAGGESVRRLRAEADAAVAERPFHSARARAAVAAFETALAGASGMRKP